MKRWAAVGIALAISGCANMDGARKYLLGDPNAPPSSTFAVIVNVDGIAAPEAAQLRSYFLMPGNDGINEGDLQYREFAAYVDRALAANGFTKAVDRQAAATVIVLQYGIGSPQTTTRTYNLPIFGQTGVSSTHTMGSFSPSYGGGGTYSGTTYNTPTYGVTGTVQRTEQQTNYSRFITLSAYDWQEFGRSQRESQVWKSTITSTGQVGDLRVVFPIMMGGAYQTLGRSTSRIVSGEVGDQSEPVRMVRGLAAPAP